MAETPEQLAARLRALEQMNQNLGMLLQNQLNNNNNHNKNDNDHQAAMAKKLAALKLPLFMGKEDPMLVENWVREFENIFTAAGTPDAQKVDQATFYLREAAEIWWENEGATIRAQQNFNWEAFKKAIRDHFFPEHIKRQKYSEFSRFNQTAGMSVQEYAEKFNEYARFCPNLVPDEISKAQKFEDGLTFKIQKKEVKDRHNRKGNGESSSNPQGYDKRPRLGGNSNGNVGNGHQGGHNNNNRSNNHRVQGQQNQQGSRNRPCRECDKSHPRRNCNGDLLTFFECGEVGHKKFECPKKKNGNNQAQNGQGKNNGNNGGGYGRNSNYSNRFNNNNSQGQNDNAQGGNCQNNNNSGGSNHNGNGRTSNGRIYVMNQSEIDSNVNVVTGTFLVNSKSAYLLFYSGTSHSFIATSFVNKHALKPSSLCQTNITIPSGEVVPCRSLYQDILVNIAGTELLANLIQFDLTDFDVILGMD
ncbi:putative uncharacterized protein DDB_G0286901 [Chenopodium quinoa]|uniref:putative uncharacterized protein DDB_G0286901 n=1 Tax=Chenopodium quinoa TaxID=63459 RepID=UPI000B79177C|nr:putative uncharacterized protein DDB_G0286901 [Chenopodium quinoa]